ncbi:hypothetical protein TrRE_jg1571, partial [Triparma retinervis]
DDGGDETSAKDFEEKSNRKLEGLEPTAAQKRAEKINYGRLQKEFLILYFAWRKGLKGKVIEKIRGLLRMPEDSPEGAIAMATCCC